MIVTCPSCASQYRIEDSSLSAGGMRVQCAKCQQVFVAQAQETALAPTSKPTVGPRVAQRQPWQGSEQNAASDHALAQANDAFAGLFSTPSAATPAQPVLSSASEKNAAHADIIAPNQAVFKAQAAVAEDPFANIKLTVPEAEPLAGNNDASIRPSMPPRTAISAMVERAQSPKTRASLVIRERDGQEHSFKYLPQAREFVSAHTEAKTLEVSIAGAPFTKVVLARAFADLSFDAAIPSKSASAAVTASSSHELSQTPAFATGHADALTSRPVAAEVKSTVPLADPGAPTESKPSRLRLPPIRSRFAVGLTFVLWLVALIYAAWQCALLPLDPWATQHVSNLTGVASPRLVPKRDVAFEIEEALNAARLARDNQQLSQAVLLYRRALLYAPENKTIAAELVQCHELMGDEGAARELRQAFRLTQTQ